MAPALYLAELRSLHDFVVKYELQAVEGVSEVASIGGYVRQYQIEVDPDKLRFYDVSLDKLAMAIKGSNVDVGAKTVESTGMEFIVRGKGFLGTDGDKSKAITDIEETAITPALKGVKIHGVYDRSGLIDETMAALTHALRDEIIITAVIILLFLLRVREHLPAFVTALFAAISLSADVARAMAIPVFGGMLAESSTSFIVPTLYSAYLEMKMRFGIKDELWEETEEVPKAEVIRAA